MLLTENPIKIFPQQPNVLKLRTVDTIVFLPLNFVSSFFGMNFIDIRDMTQSQSLFWLVGCCVTAGVLAVSLCLAFSGSSLMDRFLRWKESRERHRARMADRIPDQPGLVVKGFRILGMDQGTDSWH